MVERSELGSRDYNIGLSTKDDFRGPYIMQEHIMSSCALNCYMCSMNLLLIMQCVLHGSEFRTNSLTIIIIIAYTQKGLLCVMLAIT